VADVVFCESFAFKHMTKMAFAVGADDFDASTIGIGHAFYRIGAFVITTWPTTMGYRFMLLGIKGAVALAANI